MYWRLPCGHGFCNQCLGSEAKELRKVINQELHTQQNEDPAVLITTKGDPDKNSSRYVLTCPVCQATVTLSELGL